jgi:ribosomal protein S18 acetylase RimI-like enzyme
VTASISIREAGVDDVAALSAIGHASFHAAYEKWSEPDDLVAHLEDFFSEVAIQASMGLAGCCYLLAFNGDVAVGFTKIREGTQPDEIPVARALELHQVYVMPDQQRFGIGGRLIDAATRYAYEQSAEGVWLTVWEGAPWAVNCYRKYGFEQVGTIDFKLGQATYNDLVMWRSVTAQRSESRSPS